MNRFEQKTDFSNNRNFGLDLVRACSILFVLFSHGGGFFLRQYHDLFVPIIFLGIFGVEIFFILSGFLIGTILIKNLNQSFSYKKILNFLVRRWFRTIPNYILFLTLNILFLFLIKNNSYSNYELALVLIKHLSFTQNLLTYEATSFFPESWSLAIEEWFYILTALIIAGINLLIKNNLKKIFTYTFFILAITPTLIRTFYVVNFNATWFEATRTTILHLDSIIWGLGLAILKHNKPDLFTRLKNKLAFLGLTTLVACSYILCKLLENNNLDSSTLAKIILPVLFSIGITLTIPYFSLLNINSSIFKNLVTKISLWSYSLYLSNLIIFSLVDQITSIKNPLIQFSLFITITFLISATCYNFFEKPFTKLRDRFSN